MSGPSLLTPALPRSRSAANGLGISTLFDRLLFNVSEDYGYTFDPNITKIIGNHTFKAGFTYLKRAQDD